MTVSRVSEDGEDVEGDPVADPGTIKATFKEDFSAPPDDLLLLLLLFPPFFVSLRRIKSNDDMSDDACAWREVIVPFVGTSV